MNNADTLKTAARALALASINTQHVTTTFASDVDAHRHASRTLASLRSLLYSNPGYTARQAYREALATFEAEMQRYVIRQIHPTPHEQRKVREHASIAATLGI